MREIWLRDFVFFYKEVWDAIVLGTVDIWEPLLFGCMSATQILVYEAVVLSFKASIFYIFVLVCWLCSVVCITGVPPKALH